MCRIYVGKFLFRLGSFRNFGKKWCILEEILGFISDQGEFTCMPCFLDVRRC